MNLKDFDIELTPLTHQDIETVRTWRNSDTIKRYALDQEHIKQEQQERWFATLATKEDEYFLIHAKNKPVGLIWYNKQNEVYESGFYLYDTDIQNSLMPYKIVSIFHHYLFETKGFKKIQCKILHDNKRAVRFNLSLGFKEVMRFERYTTYILTYDAYKKADATITKLLLREKK
ncbi:MAG: GNAT family N-acetyltransferase [Candidatus Cloacimonetes bacterium]|nr:GNAT family N-acetyltransferase [Candidatus Cloacimonadota bacterium]